MSKQNMFNITIFLLPSILYQFFLFKDIKMDNSWFTLAHYRAWKI